MDSQKEEDKLKTVPLILNGFGSKQIEESYGKKYINKSFFLTFDLNRYN